MLLAPTCRSESAKDSGTGCWEMLGRGNSSRPAGAKWWSGRAATKPWFAPCSGPFCTNDQRDRFGALRCLQVMGCKLWIMEIERGLAKLSQFECEASRWAPSPSAGCAAGQKPSLSLDLLTPHCSTFTTDGQGSLPSSSTCLSCCAQVLPRAPFSGDELATQEGRPSGSSGRILTV